MGSPFYVEIYDPNKIRVEGSRSGEVGERMEFDGKPLEYNYFIADICVLCLDHADASKFIKQEKYKQCLHILLLVCSN